MADEIELKNSKVQEESKVDQDDLKEVLNRFKQDEHERDKLDAILGDIDNELNELDSLLGGLWLSSNFYLEQSHSI